MEYIQGRAAFENSTTLRISKADGTEVVLSFDRIILATGSRPAIIPALKLDSPRMMDSTGALNLEDIPGSLLVVGGGYIGLELGSVYAALGTRVTVVEMLPGLLPGADRDLVLPLHKRLEKMFEAILLNTTVASLKEDGAGIRANFEGAAVQDKDREKIFDRVLVSVGRKPNSEIPGLEKTQVQVSPRGFIEVNKQLQTADSSIYAIGDVVGEPMLAHKAMHEGRVAVEAIAGHKVAFEPSAIPAVVFTDPEVAWCGLTETQAEKENREIKVAKFPWGASGRAVTLDRPDGMTKLLIDPQTERVLGVGIVGVGAGELIAEGVLAIEMAALARDVAMSIHPHPTLSETVMEVRGSFLWHEHGRISPQAHVIRIRSPCPLFPRELFFSRLLSRLVCRFPRRIRLLRSCNPRRQPPLPRKRRTNWGAIRRMGPCMDFCRRRNRATTALRRNICR